MDNVFFEESPFFEDHVLFEEPFRIRVRFSDGSSQEFVVSEQDLIFFQSNLGPDDSLIILEDIGLRTLEQRVLRNEQNLVLIGQDTTELGLIDVRQDSDIQAISSRVQAHDDLVSPILTKIGQDLTFLGTKTTEIDERLNTHIASGGDGGDFFGGLFGGIGIGSIAVLGLLAFILFRSKIL